MTEKYQCPNCGRCFVDWGAKKLSFLCPDENCEKVRLILLTSNNHYISDKLKTIHSKTTAEPFVNLENDILELDNTLSIDDDDDSDEDLDDNDDEIVNKDIEKISANQYQENKTKRNLLIVGRKEIKGKKKD
jgi:hypothetical protein